MHYTDFEIPETRMIARAALEQLRRYATHVVIHGRDRSMSLAVNEGEAFELADPEKGDVFFPIEQLVEALECAPVE